MSKKHDIWDAIEDASLPQSLDEEMFELISAYADGECTNKEKRLVEAYLAENSTAREVLASMRIHSELMMDITEEPPAWLESTIFEKTTRKEPFFNLSWLRKAWIPVGSLSAAGILALMLVNPNSPISTEHEKYVLGAQKPEVTSSIANNILEGLPEETALNTPTLTVDDLSVGTFNRPSTPKNTSKNALAVKNKSINGIAEDVKTNMLGMGSPTLSDAIRVPKETMLASKPMPEAPDVIALANENQDDTISKPTIVGTGDQIPDHARERLRNRLRTANENQQSLPKTEEYKKSDK